MAQNFNAYSEPPAAVPAVTGFRKPSTAPAIPASTARRPACRDRAGWMGTGVSGWGVLFLSLMAVGRLVGHNLPV